MAVNPRDVDVTREMVAQWLEEWENFQGQRPSQRTFILGKLTELGLGDTVVNTTANDSLGDETSLLDLIMDDLPSYG